jgi:poly(3-hydroxybutyrate) depolymerase
MRTSNQQIQLFLTGALAISLGGCSPSNETSGIGASGGSIGTGAALGTGGATAGSGGTSTSGAATGGASTSGAATGGASTGGAATGGASAGKGGANDAGRSGRGGAAAGGRSGAGGASGAAGDGQTGGQAMAGGSGGGSAATMSAGCGKAPSLMSGDGQSISVSGSSRTFNLDIPENYDNNHPYRLIVSYHWLNGTANNVSNGGVAKPYYGLWTLAAGSTIFVAPQGIDNAWKNSGGADVEFSRQLITLLENEFCIDKSRIFAEGFSMGGSMSYAMACAMGDVVRAVAVHSGGPMSGCDKSSRKPVAYFMTHGTQDSVCTYPGYGVPQVEDYAKLDGCTAQSMPTPTDSSGKTPVCVDYAGCTAGYPVRACIFVGDHTPSPGGTSGWVPTESWKFLSQF